MDPQKLFRKAALEKLSSPERLDVMMQVTSPAGWLALSALGVLLFAVIVWSVVGNIAIKVQGNGILIRGGSVLDITAGGGGRIVEIAVKPGEDVAPGQVVARLDQPDLAVKIANAREEIQALAGEGEVQRAAQNRLLARYQQQAAELRRKIETQEQLVARGLLTRTQLMATQSELTSTEQQIASFRTGAAERSMRIDQVRRELRELESQMTLLTEVRSPYAGRVLEVAANVGDLISQGSRLLTVEDTAQDIRAVIFIPAAEGKKVQAGMRAYISPSTVRSEEYGFMLAEVKSVSDFPLTPEGLRRILRNEALVAELSGRSAPIEVTAALIPDEKTASGFRWSSSQGPPFQVFSGTVCSASVEVDSRRPIGYVLPIVKRAVGAS